MMSSNPIATRWLMQVKDDKRTETLQKITVKDIVPAMDKFKYIKIGEDGSAVIKMPFSTMQNGIALDNTCKATEEMSDFAKTIEQDMTKCIEQLDRQIELLEKLEESEAAGKLFQTMNAAKEKPHFESS